jgi:hypothetical protein
MEKIALKEHFEKILAEKEKSYNQRFLAQEAAIDKAEANRDQAIKKAEDSIEKKSDAVYVKLTDLQKALTEVMLRPEIESRLKALTEKVDDAKLVMSEGKGKEAGIQKFIGWIVAAVAIATYIIKNMN